MSFLDRLRRTADELELEARARRLQDSVARTARAARERAGDFTAEHREQIDGYVESASRTIDEKTEGRYADRVAAARESVGRGIDKVADGRPAPASTGTPTGTPAGTPTTPAAPPGETGPSASDESGFAAAAGDVPAPTREALADSTLEDTVLGLDMPPGSVDSASDDPNTPGSQANRSEADATADDSGPTPHGGSSG
jgi:hypothetical protein